MKTGFRGQQSKIFSATTSPVELLITASSDGASSSPMQSCMHCLASAEPQGRPSRVTQVANQGTVGADTPCSNKLLAKLVASLISVTLNQLNPDPKFNLTNFTEQSNKGPNSAFITT